MKKTIQWVLAATLICGASVFTACSSDNDDNPSQQAKKNRTEFIEHTRANLKYMAENLNYTSWDAANDFNSRLNQYVLNNPDFKKAIVNTFIQNVLTSIKPVEAGSELAAAGYNKYAVVDLAQFNYRFTMNDTNDGFTVEPSDGKLEVVLNGWNSLTQKVEKGMYKVVLDASGTTSELVMGSKKVEDLAIIIKLASDFEYAILDNYNGTWNEDFKGVMAFRPLDGATDSKQGYKVDAKLNTNFTNIVGKKDDNTELTFSMAVDHVAKKGGGELNFKQNGVNLLNLSIKETGDGGGLSAMTNLSLTQLPSLFDLIATLMPNRSIDEAKITLLDDLTTTLSISDVTTTLKVALEMARARRNYADYQTIDKYTQLLNELVKGEMTCKGLGQTIPMKMQTTKFGVDYWSVPALNFADENGYVALTDMLDKESAQYMINIMDHTIQPAYNSAVVIRQLIQYGISLINEIQAIQDQLP